MEFLSFEGLLFEFGIKVISDIILSLTKHKNP